MHVMDTLQDPPSTLASATAKVARNQFVVIPTVYILVACAVGAIFMGATGFANSVSWCGEFVLDDYSSVSGE